MTERTAFERSLTAWMADETSGGMAERAVSEIIDATSSVRQSRHWLARLREPALRWDRRTGAGTSRRRLTLVAVVALLVLAALAAFAGGWRPFTAAELGDWNGFHAGPGRTGTSDAGPVGRPVFHWRFRAGDSVKDAIAIAGDLVVAPSQDGVLHGIQLSDGSERWRFAPGTSVTAPFVEGGQVFVTDGHGIVHGLDLATGAERWHSSEVFDSATSPTAGNGLVIIGTGGGELVALETSTGARRWRVKVSAAAVHEPAFADGTVYVTAGEGTIEAIRAVDGTQIWKINVGADPTGTPSVSGGIVYVGSRSSESGGRLRALDAATGATLWQADEPWLSPSVSGGMVVSGRDDGQIVALDARSGAERWRIATGGPTSGSTRGPAIVGSTVFFSVDLGKWVGALDLATGRLLWRYDVDASNQCCIAVAKGYVVIGTMAGSVYAIGGDGAAVSPQPLGSLVAPTAASPTALTPASPSVAPSTAQPEPFNVVSRHTAGDLGLDHPLGLAIGPSGDVYISDLSMRITQLTADGTVVRRWGGAGSGRGQFDFVPAAANANVNASIGVGPDGKVYVSDSDNHRIQVFTAAGKFIREFGSLGSAPGQFTVPFDVSADAAGNVYVTDDGLRRLTKFSPDGEPLWVADASTDAVLDGHLHDADVDADGRVVLMNDDLKKVVIMSPAGEVVESFDAPGCDVTFNGSGRFYVTGCFGGISVYDLERHLVAQTAGSDLLAPQFGPNGEIFALDQTGAVVRLALAQPSASPAQ
jgi:outer membrane protein assembly factor BamB